MSDQPEALRLAADLEDGWWWTKGPDEVLASYTAALTALRLDAARLLREQHAEIERLRYHLRTITFSAELVQNYVAQLGADCEEARKERTS